MRILICSVLASISIQAAAETNPLQTLNSIMSTKKAVETSVQNVPVTAQQSVTPQIQTYTDLISSLATTANTDTQKAEGGLGSLLSLAQGSMGSNEFGQLSQAFPDAQKLISMAPPVSSQDSSTSGLKSAASMLLGGKADSAINSLDKASQVKQQFDALGLSAEMIPQFISMTQSFLQGQSSNGGKVDYAALLQMGLGALSQ